jgi:hypothetical protein
MGCDGARQRFSRGEGAIEEGDSWGKIVEVTALRLDREMVFHVSVSMEN